MEAAAIFIISSIHRKRAGGVMVMASLDESADETPEEKKALFNVDRAIRVGIEGMKLLIEKDKQQVA